MVVSVSWLEIYGTKVNGKLTVTENVADAGGLSSTLQVLKTDMTKPNLKDYFENYANIWKQKASLQYNKYTMVQDVHAPNELRVNQQLKNLPEFYEAYPQIKENLEWKHSRFSFYVVALGNHFLVL